MRYVRGSRFVDPLTTNAGTSQSMNVLEELFEQHFHSAPARYQPLQGQLGGSGRRIIRLANETSTAIGVLHAVREENLAFLEFSRHFRRHGLPSPKSMATT